MVGVLDQHQDSEGSNFGFGQNSGVPSRGQVFTAGISGAIGTVGFSRNKGANDIRVSFDTASANLPDHAYGSQPYSFIIPIASIIDGYGTYDLPVPFPVTAGQKYCFYLEPFWLGVYADDYQDCHGVGGGGVELTQNSSHGSFYNENLTFHYATYVTQVQSNVGSMLKMFR